MALVIIFLLIGLAITYGVVAGAVWLFCDLFGLEYSIPLASMIWFVIMCVAGKVKKRGSK